MQFRLRRLWPALSVAILVAVTARPSAETIEAVLVKVNGDILTKTDLEQRQVQYMRAKNLQPADDAALKKTIEEITPEVVSAAIDEILLVQRGKALNYKMTDEDFDRLVQNIRKENKLDTEEAFQAALKQEGMTLPELHKAMERQMLIARVTQNEVMSKVGITEEEARKYHSEHLQDFTKPGTVTIREILVKVPLENGAINVAADQAARQKADDIRKRALAGESFDQLASEVSDSPSKANGGLIGPLNMNELTPAFKKLVDPMKVGDVSDVLPGQGGYQIIKIESRTADEVMTPEDAFSFEVTVANDIAGIGLDRFDASGEFGSNDLSSLVQMDAISKFPDDPATKFLGENNTLSVIGQEVGHRWLAFLHFSDHNRQNSEALLGRDQAHWSFFFNSDASVMEGNRIEDLGGGTFRTTAAVERYSLLDQYAMGLVRDIDVPSMFYVESPTGLPANTAADSAPRVGVTFSGTRRDLLINDVIEVMGARQPSSANSPRVFRQAFLFVVGRGRTAAPAAIAKIERIRRAWEPFFARAVDNRGRVETRLSPGT